VGHNRGAVSCKSSFLPFFPSQHAEFHWTYTSPSCMSVVVPPMATSLHIRFPSDPHCSRQLIGGAARPGFFFFWPPYDHTDTVCSFLAILVSLGRIWRRSSTGWAGGASTPEPREAEAGFLRRRRRRERFHRHKCWCGISEVHVYPMTSAAAGRR